MNPIFRAASCFLLLPGALASNPALSQPVSQAQGSIPSTTAPVPPPVEQFTLRNGMTVIVKPDNRAPTVAHMLWVRVGSMDEVDGTSGVAHVLEHMLFKGTAEVRAGEFSRRVAALGGRENAFTSRDATGYHQQLPAARLEEVMRLEADRFANNQWPDEEFKREIEVVKEERRLRTEESPRAQMFELANALMFTASPYRRPIVGWMSDLDAMTPDDAREFYRRWYVPANAAVVIAGDVKVAEVRRLAEKYYGAIAARPVPARKPRLEPEQSGPRRMDFKAVASQSYVAMAFKVPKVEAADLPPAPAAGMAVAALAASPGRDALALTVLSAVLDGYNGARLQRALEQGQEGKPRVADSAGSSNGLMGRGPQIFMLSGVPAEGKTSADLSAGLLAEVAKIAREGVSDAELNRVKTQWAAGETYKLDGIFNQARELGSNWVTGLPLDAGTRLIAQLRTISSAEVQSVAARYFGEDQMTTATLLPQPADPDRKPRGRPASGTATPRH
ncbi:MAG: peptidase domain protein [Polaromonas sp.]|nr:peptidase domain protein [Polaromonas sp.]